MTTIPCVECLDPIEVKARGRKPRFCGACVANRRRLEDQSRKRQIREDQAELREAAENLRDVLDPSMFVHINAYVQSMGVDLRPRDIPLSHDQMPDGSASNGGSDDGMSTTLPSLQAELDLRRMEVIAHDWFKDNPRWNDGLLGGKDSP